MLNPSSVAVTSASDTRIACLALEDIFLGKKTNSNMDPSASAVKIKSAKDISIPYILNGELYEILTQDGENVTVKCCSCPSDRVYRGSVRSTGNFHMHIKRRHPDLLGKLHEMKVESLLVRREKLLRAKKLAMRGRIKKEDSISAERTLSQDTACTGSQCEKRSLDFPQRDEIQDFNANQCQEMESSPSTSEREPNIIITTEVHCDRDANMGVLAPPMYFPAIKEEPSSTPDDQAIDLSTSSKRCDNSCNIPIANLRWEQVLHRVESSLKEIQHEMRTRNQIETNRIFLDLAKFKYLNPGFHYQS